MGGKGGAGDHHDSIRNMGGEPCAGSRLHVLRGRLILTGMYWRCHRRRFSAPVRGPACFSWRERPLFALRREKPCWRSTERVFQKPVYSEHLFLERPNSAIATFLSPRFRRV